MRKRSIVYGACLVLLAVTLGCATVTTDNQACGSSAEPVALFDGKTFTGWEGNLEWFRIENGAIVAGTIDREIPRNEFLCTTREYSDFELRLRAKAIGEGVNAGIQFRSHRIPNDNEVSGYQADIGGESGQYDIVWGSLYDESRRNTMLVVADAKRVEQVLKPDGWNEYVIRCEGNRIQMWLNSLLTVDYVETDDSIVTTGLIAVQIHGGPPSEAWYKDITIREIQ